MSVFLYRVGKFAFRHKWAVVATWLVALIGLNVLAATVAKPFKDDFNMPNLPSERATEILDREFPGMSEQFDFDAVTGQYVVKAPEGEKLTDPANVKALDELVDAIATMEVDGEKIVDNEGQNALSNPVTVADDMGCLDPGADRGSADYIEECSGAPLNVLGDQPDTVATFQVGYLIESFADVTADEREAAYDIGADARDAGLQVEVGGVIATEQEAPGGTAELIGMGVALVVMIIAFGALLAPFIPILTAIVGLGTAMALITLGTTVTDVPSFVTFLASMIGIALSIDYALFIVSRYKHELHVAPSREEAAGRAVGTAGTAVVFAGLTVVIALSGLWIVGVRFLGFMGTAAAIAAALAVLSALTLMPALLGIFGKALFKPKLPFGNQDPEDDTQVGIGMRIARGIARFPLLSFLAAMAALVIMALPAVNLSLGLPGEESMPKDTTVRKAYDLRTEGFGEGSNGALMVVADLTGVEPSEREAALDALQDELSSSDEMDYVVGPMLSSGEMGEDPTAADYADSTGAFFNAVPVSGPNNQETKDLVRDVREAESGLEDEYGIEYGVTGTTAIYADIDHVMLSSLVPYLAVVAGAAFLLLMLVFRSVIVPAAAALGFLLSMGATFGATVFIFQEDSLGWLGEERPIVSFLPIMLIGLVFGLAMDYTLFTVTRMREEYVHGRSARDAVVHGYHHGARVVTAAAIIMISVFSAFMLEEDVTAKTMGFGLAAAVLIDAFIVRMVLLPALLILLGDKAWWLPKWLDRLLPNVDVEGEQLMAQVAGKPDPDDAPELVNA